MRADWLGRLICRRGSLSCEMMSFAIPSTLEGCPYQICHVHNLSVMHSDCLYSTNTCNPSLLRPTCRRQRQRAEAYAEGRFVGVRYNHGCQMSNSKFGRNISWNTHMRRCISLVYWVVHPPLGAQNNAASQHESSNIVVCYVLLSCMCCVENSCVCSNIYTIHAIVHHVRLRS